MADKCSLCQKSLGKNDKREVTTNCGHTFHRECANQRLHRGKRADCPTCRKDSALGDALIPKGAVSIDRSDPNRKSSIIAVCSFSFRCSPFLSRGFPKCVLQ